MKQKTINFSADFGVRAVTGWCSGEFTIIAENERHILNIHLVNSQLTDLLANFRAIIEKRREEVADYERAFEAKP
jgi:hypothetical protein